MPWNQFARFQEASVSGHPLRCFRQEPARPAQSYTILRSSCLMSSMIGLLRHQGRVQVIDCALHDLAHFSLSDMSATSQI
jgi:hypothetical protein